MTNGTIDRDALVGQNPILRTLENRYGFTFKQQGADFYAHCPFHADGKRPNLRINETKGVWFCDVCDKGGSVIDFVMQREGLGFREACAALGGVASEEFKYKPPQPKSSDKPEVESRPVAFYDYRDIFGNLVYQAVRMEPKSFRQRRPVAGGKWEWNMEGVTRVLYRLPELIEHESEIVSIVEGEKDANTLWELGFPATCNVAGAKKWMDGYSNDLIGRDVAIWPDNDEPGREHAKQVFESLVKKARSVRIMRVPDPHKDVTDWLERIPEESDARIAVEELITGTSPRYGGVELPIKSMSEMETSYRQFARRSHNVTFDLSNWLLKFGADGDGGNRVRPLVPGELVMVIGSTGVGKTVVQQSMAMAAAPMPVLFFELELPEPLTFERFAAGSLVMPGEQVFDAYRAGASVAWGNTNRLNHIYTACQSGLDCDAIERCINNVELKIGERPVVVFIDYIGLVKSQSKSRYERMSDIAERMRVMAKNTNTIVICNSQMGRTSKEEDEDPAPTLHSAKDSGSIENSSGLVLGIWREPNKFWQLNVRVLKNTKGRPGKTIACRFRGASSSIVQMSVDDPGLEQEPQLNYEQSGNRT